MPACPPFSTICGKRSPRARPTNWQRSCNREGLGRLLLEAMRRVTVAVVSPRERNRRQPGLAADNPALVGRRQLIGRVEGAEINFDFVAGAGEDGRAAARTEMTHRVIVC